MTATADETIAALRAENERLRSFIRRSLAAPEERLKAWRTAILLAASSTAGADYWQEQLEFFERWLARCATQMHGEPIIAAPSVPDER